MNRNFINQTSNEIAVRIRNAPLIFKLFSSMALFIIIPVMIVSLIADLTILRYSETEIGKSGIGKLKVAKSLTELLAEGVTKDVLRISLNKDLNILYAIPKYKQVLENTNNVMLFSKFSDTLAEVVSTNTIYQSITLYPEDADYVLASLRESNNVLKKNEYKDRGWLKDYHSFVTRRTKLTWLKTRVFKSAIDNHAFIPLEDNVITYVFPLTPFTTKLRGAVVVNIYEAALSNQINGNNFDKEGYIGILSDQGDVISHVDKKLVGQNISNRRFVQSIRRSSSNEGYLITDLNHKKYLISYLKTDFNSWIYIGVFQLDTLMTKATAWRIGTMAIALGLVVIGLLFSYLVSRQLYHPVQKLIQDIRQHKGIDINASENEMTLLSRAFDTIIRQDDLISDKLEQNKRRLLENHLANLIMNHESQSETPEFIADFFPNKYFIGVLVSIDRHEEFLNKYSKEQQYYMKVLITKILGEIHNANLLFISVILEHDKLGIVVNVDHFGPQIQLQLRNDLSGVQEEYAKISDNTFSAAIGDCHEGLSGLKTSFTEARETLKLKLIQGYARINVWQSEQFDNKKYDYPFTTEKHILNNLDLGLKNETITAVDNLVNNIEKRNDLSYDNIILIFNQLLGSTVKYLIESRISVSDIFGNDDNVYQQLAAKETLEEIRHWLVNIYSRIFEYQNKPVLNDTPHFTKIMDFIHQNYRRDIDINSLAEYVGLSYSHVRKIFHDETGENIVNYINNLRIEEAKRLLRKTDMTVGQIALQLGYNNNQSFNRFFKKYEGVTPGEFRNIKTATPDPGETPIKKARPVK